MKHEQKIEVVDQAIARINSLENEVSRLQHERDTALPQCTLCDLPNDNTEITLDENDNEVLVTSYCKRCDYEQTLHNRIAMLKEDKGTAYSERDRLVAALSKLFPSYLARHLADEAWDEDWRWIVYVQLPTGQASWHIHDSELGWFDHLNRKNPGVDSGWDGHTTEQKYERLAALKPTRST